VREDHVAAHSFDLQTMNRGLDRGNRQDYQGEDFVSPNNYEVPPTQELLKLDGELYVPGQGLSIGKIRNIPTTLYSGKEDVCAICTEVISAGQQVRTLPCSHLFHFACIDNWLGRVPRCPVDNLPLSH